MATDSGVTSAEARSRPSQRERILVVDDEPQIRALLKNILAGYDVRVAASGREAIAALDQARFAAVVCDLVMPDTTGMDVYEHVRRTRPGDEKKMVFITGGAFTPRARQFVDHLPERVLHKPFRPLEVLALLERVLSGALDR